MISVLALFTVHTIAYFLETGLAVARTVGLPVDSWQTGDPTRSLYKYLAEVLAGFDGTHAEYIKAGFLSTAEDDWLRVLAWEVYGVEAEDGSAATSTITLDNAGGGLYVFAAGDIVVKSTTSGKTYHNADGGTLNPLSTLSLSVVADEVGSDSSAGADEIDAVVSPTLIDVSITSSTAAVGVDAESNESIRDRCRASTGALSPNGPPDAYEFVCTNSALTGVTDITRATSTADSDTGDVSVYVASASGPASGASVTAAQAAVLRWSTPLCITPTVSNATAEAQDLEVEVSGDDLPADYESRIESAHAAYLATIRIGGTVVRSRLFYELHRALGLGVKIAIIDPADDVALSAGVVPTPGTVTATEV